MGRDATGTIFEKPPGSGRWYYSLTLRSKKRWTRPVPAHPSGRPIAEREARSYKDELVRLYAAGEWDPERPAAPPPPPVETVAEYATRWAAALPHLTSYVEQGQVKHHIVLSSLGPMPLDAVEGHHVVAWVHELRTKSVMPGQGKGTLAPLTVRAIAGTLGKMFDAARFAKLVTGDPCTLPPGTLPARADKVPGARRTWRYERDDVERLLSDPVVPASRRVLYAVLFLTGARVGEAVSLRWRHFEPGRTPLGCLAIEMSFNAKKRVEKGTKTGVVREIPVHPTLAAVLAEWRLAGWKHHQVQRPAAMPRGEEFVVPSETGTRRAATNVYRQLKADCVALEIRPRRVHGSRHTFISLAMDDGARADIIKKLTHPSPSSAFDVYRSEGWPTFCAEVVKLRVVRRLDALPLWQAVGGGGDRPGGGSVQSDSATPIATDAPSMSLMDSNQATSTTVSAASRDSDIRMDRAGNKALRMGSSKEVAPIPGAGDASDGDTATTGSATPSTGPHLGEAQLYLWFERQLLETDADGGGEP